jgi:hypothetical protein
MSLRPAEGSYALTDLQLIRELWKGTRQFRRSPDRNEPKATRSRQSRESKTLARSIVAGRRRAHDQAS